MPMRVGLPSHPQSFLIEKRGNLTVAQDSRGRIQYSGTDAASVIQSALNSLTSGRTWQEKVVLKGNFTTSSPIILDSYTILEVYGKITLAAGANCNIIQNKNQDTHDDYITISGGMILDGNKANSNGNGIYIKNTDDGSSLLIENVRVQNVKQTGVYLQKLVELEMRNVLIVSADGDGLYCGIVWDSRIDDLIVSNTNGRNVALLFCGASSYSNWYLGGASYAPAEAQLFIQGVTYSQFDNIRVDYIPINGIKLDGSNNNVFTNLHITHPVVASLTAINFYSSSSNTFQNLFITKDDGTLNWGQPIYEGAGSNYNQFLGGVMQDWDAGVFLTGASSKVRNIIGFVTQNGGTATFSGNGSTTTFTIAHGLASTPTKVLVTAGSSAAKGDFYVTASATNITVTYGTAPASGTNNVILNWYAEV
jgi:hypothetical protein